jgi:pimeloyl-ACP methyl ester carboxylesterase
VERFATYFADSELSRRFDIIGFDPRGIGFSTPELRCRTDAEMDEERRDPMVDFSPAGVARIEDFYREYGEKCRDRMGADFLASMDTLTTARDMDAVRSALGEEQINYLGFSYGTRLGTAYAELFGNRVRAMVLDGVVDQNVDPIEEMVGQTAAFQDAFDTYAADCAKSPSCPLGTDPAQFVSRYRQLVDPLVAKPARTADPRGLSYQDAIEGTNAALYNPDDWQDLTDGLSGLANGTDADDLLELADRSSDRDDNGHYGSDDDAFSAIHCVDQTYPTDPAVWAEADRRWRAAAPYQSFGEFTGFAPRDACVFWPVQPASEPHPPTSPGPGKVVVVSTTGDPATPYQVGVDIAAQLGAPVITYEGSRHTVTLRGVECVDHAVEKFFIDLVLPPAGLRC